VFVLIVGAIPAGADDATLLRAREGAAALLRGQYDKAVTAYNEALTNPEIAEALGISSITVAVTLHRTRRELQKKLRAS